MTEYFCKKCNHKQKGDRICEKCGSHVLLDEPTLPKKGMSKKGMSKKKKFGIVLLGIGIVFIVLPFVSLGLMTPDEKRELNIEIEQRKSIKKMEARQKEAEKIQQKKLDEYESIVTQSGRLKYRPYWMVEDKYEEMERSGEILKNQRCADLVTKIREVESGSSLQTMIHKQWVETCIRFN